MKKYMMTIAALLFGMLTAFADNVSVADVTMQPGQTVAVGISLNNTETNLVSFQMDLTLPEGISINKAGCSLSSRFTDENQELTIGKQDGNVYRLMSTSYALIPISGTSGEIITLSLTASANSNGGTATIDNIRLVTSNSQKLLLNDASFNITIGKPITFADDNVKALCVANWDTNGDGELSEAEAAAVTDLGEVFKGNTEITSFDELQYFTGLTAIGNQAFYGCTGLTSVVIPNSVTSIGIQAFYGCTSLADVDIQNTEASIGLYAFNGCADPTLAARDKLISWFAPVATGSLKASYGDYFKLMRTDTDNKHSIDANRPTFGTTTERITFTHRLKTGGKSGSNNGLTLTFPRAGTLKVFVRSGSSSSERNLVLTQYGSEIYNRVVKDADATAIDNGDGTTTNIFPVISVAVQAGTVLVTYPTGALYFYGFAFEPASQDPSPAITFADANVKALCVANWDTDGDGELSEAEAAMVTDLGEVFKGNTEITSFNELQYFKALTRLPDWNAFNDCTSLKSIVIPAGVTSIWGGSFANCSSLEHIVVDSSNGVYDSHNNCNAIIETATNKLVVGCWTTSIPDDVTAIGYHAFWGRWGMQTMTIPESVTEIYDGAFAFCVNLKTIVLPSQLTALGSGAFTHSGLTTISLPETLISIGENAFEDVPLTLVTANYPVPVAIAENTFSNRANAVLSVPYGSKAAYEAADYWKDFKEIIEIDNRNAQTLDYASIPAMTYGDAAYTLPQKTNEGLVLTWSVDNDAVATVSGNILTIVGAGSATVTATQAGNDSYKPFSREFTLTVAKAAAAVATAPTAKDLTYTGSPQELVNAGAATGGTMQYSLDGTTYSADIPTATDAGSYTVYYKVIGDANHTDTEPATVSVTIAEAEQPGVEVTDISTLDNVIYVKAMRACKGTEATISFRMKNTAQIRSFQFDLYLPEGVTVVKSNKGRIQGALYPARLPEEDGHTLTFSEHDDVIRFLCGSQYDETFIGNEGVIATLKVNVSEDMADGDYPIQLKDMKLSETDIDNYYETALVQTKLTIAPYITGDINGDNKVDVSDYTGVANHIHGNTPQSFNENAADVNEDGTIDVSDYTGIANIIHTGSIHGNATNNAPAMRKSPRNVNKSNTDVSNLDNVIYVTPFTASAGEQTTISFKMKNTAEIRGFQFDLYLPEGMTVVKSQKGRIQGALSAGRLPNEDEHELTLSEQDDGAIRFLCSSEYDETFTGNDGEIATLQVNVAPDMNDGIYSILLVDMKLTETDIDDFYETALVQTEVTIASTLLGDANGDGKVDIADVTAIINKINNVPPASFNETAADVNGDGKIDIADVTGVINIINR